MIVSMKKITLIMIGMIAIFLLLSINVAGQRISTQTHSISITKETSKIIVNENLKIKGETGQYYETLSFWIPTGNSNLKIFRKG